jgi:hypothetical protein
MIINLLDQKINDMRDLQRLESLQANNEQQAVTDARFRAIVTRLHQFVMVIEYLRKEAPIEQDDTLKNDIIILLNNLKTATELGLTDKDKVTAVETKFTLMQAECKKNWTKQYSELTSARVSTLKVISGIDAEKVASCLQNIQKAEVWNTDISTFKAMMAGLESADQLITNLGLNQSIISFLQNVNQGKATLADLTDDVLAWIKEEDLETKIKLSFKAGSLI